MLPGCYLLWHDQQSIVNVSMQENYCGLVNNGYSSRSNYKHAACIIASWSLAVLFTFSNQNLNPSKKVNINFNEKIKAFSNKNHLNLIFLIPPKYVPTPTKAWKINVKNYQLWLMSCIFRKQTKYQFYIIFFQASKYVQTSKSYVQKPGSLPIAIWPYVCNRRSKMPTYLISQTHIYAF